MKNHQIKITIKKLAAFPLERTTGIKGFPYRITKITGAVSVFSAGNHEHNVGDIVDTPTAKDLANHYEITTLP